MSAEVKTFTANSALLGYLVSAITSQLQDAITARGQAYLVVSGGRTPIPLFEQLSMFPLAWQKVTVLLADDRWVPASHQDSNARLVRQHLLQNQAAHAQFIGLVGEHANIAADVQAVQAQLTQLPTFDVVILGMGDDGHTASLFPCSEELNEGLQTSATALAVTPTSAPHQRISLSRTRLMNSRQLYLHISGASKAAVLNTALHQPPTATKPISFFLHQSDVPMQVVLAGA